MNLPAGGKLFAHDCTSLHIGGGTFTVQNKILPGAYINFVSLGSVVKMGTRGVAALPLELNWGPENKVFSVYAEDFNKNALSVFGYDRSS